MARSMHNHTSEVPSDVSCIFFVSRANKKSICAREAHSDEPSGRSIFLLLSPSSFRHFPMLSYYYTCKCNLPVSELCAIYFGSHISPVVGEALRDVQVHRQAVMCEAGFRSHRMMAEHGSPRRREVSAVLIHFTKFVFFLFC